MAETVKIKIPATVVLKDDLMTKLHNTVEKMTDGLAASKKLTKEAADEMKAALKESTPKAEREFPIDELVDLVLNTAPEFRGGHTKVMRQAHRIGAAFEGKTEGDVVELSVEAHGKLRAYFDDPSYERLVDEKTGKKEVVKEPPLSAYQWRMLVPYIEAIYEGMKDEPKPAEPAKE